MARKHLRLLALARVLPLTVSVYFLGSYAASMASLGEPMVSQTRMRADREFIFM